MEGPRRMEKLENSEALLQANTVDLQDQYMTCTIGTSRSSSVHKTEQFQV